MPEPIDDAALQVYMQGAWTAFPDLTFQDTQTIAQGDYVVVNWIATGTHKGPMVSATGATFPATGRKVTYPGSETMEFKDGKIVREESHWCKSEWWTMFRSQEQNFGVNRQMIETLLESYPQETGTVPPGTRSDLYPGSKTSP